MKSRVVAKIVLMAALMLPVQSLAAVSNDQVLSQHLREADGTSAQDTNIGSGVKTGHIQDGAVIESKIANGAVTSSKLAAGAVANTNLTDGSITTDKIADGAVTDAKVTGTISGSKLGAHAHNVTDVVGSVPVAQLPVGTTSGMVAAGDHSHDSQYQKKYANVIVVARSGGDYADLNSALAAITDASPTNPYLIRIMPGVYQNDTREVRLKSYVDIEGSGEKNTVLEFFDPFLGGLWFVNEDMTTLPIVPLKSVEVRALTVRVNIPHPAGYIDEGAVYLDAAQNVALSNVTVELSGDPSNSAIFVKADADFTLKNVTVKAPQKAIRYNYDYYNPITASGLIVDSFIDGEVQINSVTSTQKMVNSMVKTLNTSGKMKTINCLDANYDQIYNGLH